MHIPAQAAALVAACPVETADNRNTSTADEQCFGHTPPEHHILDLREQCPEAEGPEGHASYRESEQADMLFGGKRLLAQGHDDILDEDRAP